MGGLLEKPQVAGIEHLRVLIADERKDRLALVALTVANLGQREIQHARLLTGRSSTASADGRPTELLEPDGLRRASRGGSAV
jgi:hypothetical protein